MFLDCGCLRKYFVLVCAVLCKICRFKCWNHNKTKNLFKKKTADLALVLTKTKAKIGHMASVHTITQAKGPAKFFI